MTSTQGDSGSTKVAHVRTDGPVQSAILAVPVIALLAGGWTYRWITDDGFIYLRVVQQIRAGNGPVFNAGERVEAFTGTIWVALLSILDLLTPVRLEWISVIVGLALSACGVVLAMSASRTLWGVEFQRTLHLPFGALAFVAITPTWVFATSGLETGLVFGWLGLCLRILATWSRSPSEKLSAGRAVVLGLGWLVRPELVLFSAAFLVLTLAPQMNRDSRPRLARTISAMVALPLAYQIFRMGYYGSLLPNTAIAKEGSGNEWARGLRYISDFAGTYWLWIPAATIIAGGYLPMFYGLHATRRTRASYVTATYLVVALLNAVYMAYVGGDYIHARLLLPAFFAIGAPVATVPATRRHLAALVLAPWVAVAVLSLRPPQYRTGNLLAGGFVLPFSAGKVTTDDFGWTDHSARRAVFAGDYTFQTSIISYASADIDLASGTPTPIAVLGGIGIVSYAIGPELHVLDYLGLADPYAGHLEKEQQQFSMLKRLPGHEKVLPAPWIAARLTPAGSYPDPDDFPKEDNPLIPPTEGAAFVEQVAWARAALKCPGISDLSQAARHPMSAGFFLENLIRSPANTRMRFPADPEDAYHRFCGPGTPREVSGLSG